MKSKFTYVVLFLQILLFPLLAQTVINYPAQVMQDGDVISLRRLDTISPGNAGDNQIWDYSNAKMGDNYVIKCKQTETTDNTVKSFACNENGERTSFYTISPSKKLYNGFTSSTSKVIFDEPIEDMSYPFYYNSEIDGVMKGTYTKNGENSTIDGTYKIVADAWGTLLLPNGKTLKNVLRVKTYEEYNQYAETTYHIIANKYAFYSSDSSYPVLQIKDGDITCDCGCNRREYNAFFNESVTSTLNNNINNKNNSGSPKFTYEVFPNPFQTEFKLNYSIQASAKINITILDLSGKQIQVLLNSTQEQGTYSIIANLDGPHGAVFILKMEVNDVVYSEKIIKK
jgi:hypothetical protein